jgi:hypothetical protein
MKHSYSIAESAVFIKSYIGLFFPKWLKYITKIKVVDATKSKRNKHVAVYRVENDTIYIYTVKNDIDLFKTILHEYAHGINNKLYNDIGHSAQWKKTLNTLRRPLYLIWKGKLNSRW